MHRASSVLKSPTSTCFLIKQAFKLRFVCSELPRLAVLYFLFRLHCFTTAPSTLSSRSHLSVSQLRLQVTELFHDSLKHSLTVPNFLCKSPSSVIKLLVSRCRLSGPNFLCKSPSSSSIQSSVVSLSSNHSGGAVRSIKCCFSVVESLRCRLSVPNFMCNKSPSSSLIQSSVVSLLSNHSDAVCLFRTSCATSHRALR
jgi:hypothetical protein